jgi:N-acetylmuramoyl-L-alanine amidase
MLKRKIKSIIIITIIVLLSSLDLISAKTLPLLGIVITIDPGHGGRDPGTMYNSIKEKDLNLEISKALEKELTKNGAIVYMIRTSDIDLSSIYDSKKKRGDLYRRLLKIKENKSNLYLSIHINWYQNSTHKGAEVLYNSINKNNKILAEAIMNEFKTNQKSKREIKKTNLYMYKNITIPGVLIETGYLSNPTERRLLQSESYQKELAKSITNGVKNYLKAINEESNLNTNLSF